MEIRRTFLNDIIFKIVFGSPQNERLLRSLLNAVLDLSGRDKIVQVTILGSELSKAYLAEKGAVLDVRGLLRSPVKSLIRLAPNLLRQVLACGPATA